MEFAKVFERQVWQVRVAHLEEEEEEEEEEDDDDDDDHDDDHDHDHDHDDDDDKLYFSVKSSSWPYKPY